MTQDNEPDARQMDEAALWHAKRAGGSMSAVDERHFQNWLNADRAHRLAFDRMRVLWGQLEMPARKLANRRQGRLLPGLMAWFGLRRIVAAAAGVAAMLALTWYVKPGLVQDWRADIVAGQSVVSTFTLPDGSVARLAANTALRLDFDQGHRRVELLRGQAFFEVVHLDSNAAFQVMTPDAVVEVVGTRFNVNRLLPRTLVTVEEGAVRVHAEAADDTVLLRPGQQALAERHGVTARDAVDLSAAFAWMSGRIDVQNISVEDLLAQLESLAGHRILALGDLTRLRISGSFPTDDVPGTLRTIALAVDGRVVETSPWLTILYSFDFFS